MKRLLILSLPIFFIYATEPFAWTTHLIFTYAAIKNMPELNKDKKIFPEPLPNFIKKERAGLADLLVANEEWSRTHIPFYMPLPEELAFKKSGQVANLMQSFLIALRVNPTLTFPLYIDYATGAPHQIHRPIDLTRIMLKEIAIAPWTYIPNPPMEALTTHDHLSAVEILSAATDEPDYGLDINLWEDSPSWFGRVYGWGAQPYGNKMLSFTTQIPFHTGYYFESALLFKIAPFLKHNYAIYRFHLFLDLSQYAFKTGHRYWGYRFLGWALHYAQDLTQPYHASIAPNIPVSKILFSSTLKLLGSYRSQQNIIQLITNRHLSLENYMYFFVNDLLTKKNWQHPLLQALSDDHQDASYPAFDDHYLQFVIANEAQAHAKTIDKNIREVFPKKYEYDPDYFFYTTEPHINLYTLTRQMPSETTDKLNIPLQNLLRAYGAHTRNIIRYVVGR